MVSNAVEEIRKLAEADFITFVKLVAPYNVMGVCHEELCKFLTNPDLKLASAIFTPFSYSRSHSPWTALNMSISFRIACSFPTTHRHSSDNTEAMVSARSLISCGVAARISSRSF